MVCAGAYSLERPRFLGHIPAMLIRIITCLISLLVTASFVAPALALSLKEPLPAEGTNFEYDIVYDGEVVGSHRIGVEHSGKNIKISHKRHIEVDVLFVKAFSEEHEAVELWSNAAELLSVDGFSDRNGERLVIHGKREGEKFQISYGGRTEVVPMPVATDDSYWATNSTSQNRVISVARAKTISYRGKKGGSGDSRLEADGMSISLVFEGDFLKAATIVDNGKTVQYRRKE